MSRPIVIRTLYPARAASSSRVNSLNTNPRRSLAEAFSHLMKSGNFIATPNSASTQSARTLPRAAIARALIVQVTRIDPLWLFFLNLVGPFEAARRSIPLLVHPFKKPCSGVSKCLKSLSHLWFHSGVYASNRSQRIVGNAQKGLGEVHHV